MTTPWEGLREYSWPQVLCSAWLIGFTELALTRTESKCWESSFSSVEKSGSISNKHLIKHFITQPVFAHAGSSVALRTSFLLPKIFACHFHGTGWGHEISFFLFSFSVLFGVLATHCPDSLPLWIIFRSSALIKASVIGWGMFHIPWITLAFWFLSSGLFAHLLVGKSLSSSILPCAGSSSAFLSFSVVSSTQLSYFLIFIQ